MAECLGEGDEAGFEQAGAECAAVGATSGADGLLGMAAALRAGAKHAAAVGASA